jgi:hypothetical protein
MNLNNNAKNLRDKVCHSLLLLAMLLGGITFLFKSNIALADKGLTNVNQVTDFFNKELGEKQKLESFLEESKKQAEGGIGNKTALTELGSTESDLENKSTELNSISANSLESRGQEERYKEENNYYNALEVDYSDPKVVNHKKDIDLIVDGSTKLIARLIDGLADLGIDCKTTKGNKEIEPEYAIEIKKEHYKDTIYNQHICEALRNRYNCTDSLTLTCKRQGIQWGLWQDKQIHVPAQELFNLGKHIFWIHHTAPRCFEYKLIVGKKRWVFGERAPNPYVVHSIREFLVTKHPGSTIDNISDEMNSSWFGGIFSIDGWTYCGRVLGYKDHAWNTYVINYKYREGSSICLEWSEDWTERCKLQ